MVPSSEIPPGSQLTQLAPMCPWGPGRLWESCWLVRSPAQHTARGFPLVIWGAVPLAKPGQLTLGSAASSRRCSQCLILARFCRGRWPQLPRERCVRLWVLRCRDWKSS